MMPMTPLYSPATKFDLEGESGNNFEQTQEDEHYFSPSTDSFIDSITKQLQSLCLCNASSVVFNNNNNSISNNACGTAHFQSRDFQDDFPTEYSMRMDTSGILAEYEHSLRTSSTRRQRPLGGVEECKEQEQEEPRELPPPSTDCTNTDTDTDNKEAHTMMMSDESNMFRMDFYQREMYASTAFGLDESESIVVNRARKEMPLLITSSNTSVSNANANSHNSDSVQESDNNTDDNNNNNNNSNTSNDNHTAPTPIRSNVQDKHKGQTQAATRSGAAVVLRPRLALFDRAQILEASVPIQEDDDEDNHDDSENDNQNQRRVNNDETKEDEDHDNDSDLENQQPLSIHFHNIPMYFSRMETTVERGDAVSASMSTSIAPSTRTSSSTTPVLPIAMADTNIAYRPAFTATAEGGMEDDSGWFIATPSRERSHASAVATSATATATVSFNGEDEKKEEEEAHEILMTPPRPCGSQDGKELMMMTSLSPPPLRQPFRPVPSLCRTSLENSYSNGISRAEENGIDNDNHLDDDDVQSDAATLEGALSWLPPPRPIRWVTPGPALPELP